MTAREVIRELEKELYRGDDCPAFLAIFDGARTVTVPLQWIQFQMAMDEHGRSKTAQVVFFHSTKFQGN